jgi:8-oxo-dGTP pyrophosphatase MutT (NUDIX family)
MAWKVLSEEILFETPYIRARQQRCETMRGAVIDPYHVFDMPNWAAMLPITPEGDAVLVNNYRHGSERVMVELPGGVIDDTDRDTDSAVQRELMEETGHKVDRVFALPKIHPYPGRFRQLAYPFLGIGAVKVAEQALEEDEDLEVFKLPLADAFRIFADGSADVAAVHGGIMLAARHLIMTDPDLAFLRDAL